MIPPSSSVCALAFLVGGISCIWSQDCPQTGDSGRPITKHYLADSTARCCRQIRCNKGTYGVPCEADNIESTKCVDCDESNFYNPYGGWSDHQTYCKPKAVCNNLDLIVADNGSTYQDRKCKCDLKNGYYKSANGPSENRPPVCMRKSCPAGMELTYDGACQDCPAYTFKNESGYGPCQPLTDCEKLGLKRDNSHHFNATHDVKCYNASTVDPNVGRVEEEDKKGHKPFIIMGGVMAAVVAVMGVVFFVIWRYQRFGADNDSHGSAGERKTCLSESSISDQEDNVENNKRMIKREHDLKVDIPIMYGDKMDLKGNHTPDSGIFTGYPPHLTPSMNGGPPGSHPPPYFLSHNLPSTGLETDAEVFLGRPADSPSNDSDLHSTSGVSSCPSKEEKISDERHPHLSGGGSIPPKSTGAPPVIHIHHHYRQIGNQNQMVVKPSPADAAECLKQGHVSDGSNCDYENDSYEDEEYEDSDNESIPEYQRSTMV